MGQTYGYVRVSSADQNTDRQIIAMREQGIAKHRIYIDKRSGKDFERPAYQRMVKRIQAGDLLIIASIDRLGRNYREILEQWRVLCREKGVDIMVLDMPLLNTAASKDLLGTFISDLVLQLLSFVSENERQYIRRRQAEGIAAARLRGVRFGRQPIETPENFTGLVACWRAGQMPLSDLLEQTGLSAATFYRRLHELNM